MKKQNTSNVQAWSMAALLTAIAGGAIFGTQFSNLNTELLETEENFSLVVDSTKHANTYLVSVLFESQYKGVPGFDQHGKIYQVQTKRKVDSLFMANYVNKTDPVDNAETRILTNFLILSKSRFREK